jgi:CRP/FNR family transcriptional regulator, cyclic AMP receptor protein
MKREVRYQELFPSLEHLGSATRYIAEITDIVDQIPLFGDLEIAEVESLCSYMQCFGAPRNVTLISEGATGEFLLIVLTGKVKVVKHSGSEVETTIAVVGPGASLGEMSMVDGEARFASCITVEPTDFAVLSRDDLGEIVHNMPRLGNKFLLLLLQVMTSRLRNASNRLLPHIAVESV